jgi:mycofactocin precursor
MLPDAMPGGRWSLVTVENGSTVAGPADADAPVAVAGAGEVDDAEELLVEEISIDGMCGVY